MVLSFVVEVWMGRRGWQHVDVPSGWIQVIRGPRPNSVVWPKARPQGVRSDPPQRTAQPQQFRQSAAQFVQKSKVGGIPAVRERKTPDTIRSEASMRVSRLQAAINSLGDGDAEAKKALESSLAKAQKQAEVPHSRQIEETREFIARARKRILHADEKIRLAEQAVAEAKEEKEYDLRELPLAESRLERLQAEERVPTSCPAAPPPPDWGAQISSLMQQVNQLQAERDSFAQMLTQQRVARGEEMPAKKFHREDFVPGCVEELVEWMGCRQQEMNDAVASGRESDDQVGWDFGGRSKAVATVDPAPVCSDEHGPFESTEVPEQSQGACQVWVERSAGWRSQQPRTAPPAPSPIRQLVGG